MKDDILRPQSEAELADAVKAAQAPLAIRGGGTRMPQVTHDAVLETAGLRGITLYEPGALTLVVQAGTPLMDVEAALAAENQRLPFEVPDMRAVFGRSGVSTIGGVVADNASGPRRVQVGACRDSLIGIRMVDGRGTVIKNGGRVMKNVTGYDLVKLMAGSRGTLGVLTEVAFKVQAMPEAEATLRISGLGPAAALAILRRAMGSPYDVSGAAHLDVGRTVADTQTLIRVEGLAGSVAYRSSELARLIGDCEVVEAGASAALWREVRDAAPFAPMPGAVWRLSVTPAKAMVVPDALSTAGIAHRRIWDWGGGRLWILAGPAATDTIKAAVAGIGHATLIRPVAGMAMDAREAAEPAGIAVLSQGLRAAFDPRGIFNQIKG
jgi:glycolate oxidase FAD binding subunit